MTLQLHRPDGRGALAPASPADSGSSDWRKNLRSPRWRAARLRNKETNPTSTPLAIVFWLALSAATFGLLLLGYGSHFWR
jgi:hypothetical protein